MSDFKSYDGDPNVVVDGTCSVPPGLDMDEVVYSAEGQANSSVYSVASSSITTFITEEDLMTSVFKTCDADKCGKVKVSVLLEYIQHVIFNDEENMEVIENLWVMFDSNGSDVLVDLETYEEVMRKWVQHMRQNTPLPVLDSSVHQSLKRSEYGDLILFSPCIPKPGHTSPTKHSSPVRVGLDFSKGLHDCTFGSLEGLGGEHSIANVVELANEINELRHQLQMARDQKAKSDKLFTTADDQYFQMLAERDEAEKKLESLQCLADKNRALNKECEDLREQLARSEEARLAAGQHVALLEKKNVFLDTRVRDSEEDARAADGKLEQVSAALAEAIQASNQCKADVAYQTELASIAEAKVENELRLEKNELEKQLSTREDRVLSDGLGVHGERRLFLFNAGAKRVTTLDPPCDDGRGKSRVEQHGPSSVSPLKRLKVEGGDDVAARESRSMPSIRTELKDMVLDRPSPFCEKHSPRLLRSVSDVSDRVASRQRAFHSLMSQRWSVVIRRDFVHWGGGGRGVARRRKSRQLSRTHSKCDDDGVCSTAEKGNDISFEDSVREGSQRCPHVLCRQMVAKLKRRLRLLRKSIAALSDSVASVHQTCVGLLVLVLSSGEPGSVSTQLPDGAATVEGKPGDWALPTTPLHEHQQPVGSSAVAAAATVAAVMPNAHQQEDGSEVKLHSTGYLNDVAEIWSLLGLDSDAESCHSQGGEEKGFSMTTSTNSVKERLAKEVEALRHQMVKSQAILTVLARAASANHTASRMLRRDILAAVSRSSCSEDHPQANSGVIMSSELLDSSCEAMAHGVQTCPARQRSVGLPAGGLPQTKTQSLDHGQNSAQTPIHFHTCQHHTLSCPILPSQISLITKGTQTEPCRGERAVEGVPCHLVTSGLAEESVKSTISTSVHGDQPPPPFAFRLRSNSFMVAVIEGSATKLRNGAVTDIGRDRSQSPSHQRKLSVLTEEDQEDSPLRQDFTLSCRRRPTPPPYRPPPPVYLSKSSPQLTPPSTTQTCTPFPDSHTSTHGTPTLVMYPVVHISNPPPEQQQLSHNDASRVEFSRTVDRLGMPEEGPVRLMSSPPSPELTCTDWESTATPARPSEAVKRSGSDVEEDRVLCDVETQVQKVAVRSGIDVRRDSVRRRLGLSGVSPIQRGSAFEEDEPDAQSKPSAAPTATRRRSLLTASSGRKQMSFSTLMLDVETSETESAKGSMESEPEPVVTEGSLMPTGLAKDGPLPSLSDSFLEKLKVHRDAVDQMGLENFSEQEIEMKFQSLALAFKSDRLTLGRRLELHQRQRDVAESNVEKELQLLTELLLVARQSFYDSTALLDLLAKTQQQVEVLRRVSTRVSSRAEVYGADQQEARLTRAVEIMIVHVENVIRHRGLLQTDLENARGALRESRAFDDVRSTRSASASPKFMYRRLSTPSGAVTYRRRASVSSAFHCSSATSCSYREEDLVEGECSVRRTSLDGTMRVVRYFRPSPTGSTFQHNTVGPQGRTRHYSLTTEEELNGQGLSIRQRGDVPDQGSEQPSFPVDSSKELMVAFQPKVISSLNNPPHPLVVDSSEHAIRPRLYWNAESAMEVVSDGTPLWQSRAPIRWRRRRSLYELIFDWHHHQEPDSIHYFRYFLGSVFLLAALCSLLVSLIPSSGLIDHNSWMLWEGAFRPHANVWHRAPPPK